MCRLENDARSFHVLYKHAHSLRAHHVRLSRMLTREFRMWARARAHFFGRCVRDQHAQITVAAAAADKRSILPPKVCAAVRRAPATTK